MATLSQTLHTFKDSRVESMIMLSHNTSFGYTINSDSYSVCCVCYIPAMVTHALSLVKDTLLTVAFTISTLVLTFTWALTCCQSKTMGILAKKSCVLLLSSLSAVGIDLLGIIIPPCAYSLSQVALNTFEEMNGKIKEEDSSLLSSNADFKTRLLKNIQENDFPDIAPESMTWLKIQFDSLENSLSEPFNETTFKKRLKEAFNGGKFEGIQEGVFNFYGNQNVMIIGISLDDLQKQNLEPSVFIQLFNSFTRSSDIVIDPDKNLHLKNLRFAHKTKDGFLLIRLGEVKLPSNVN